MLLVVWRLGRGKNGITQEMLGRGKREERPRSHPLPSFPMHPPTRNIIQFPMESLSWRRELVELSLIIMSLKTNRDENIN